MYFLLVVVYSSLMIRQHNQKKHAEFLQNYYENLRLDMLKEGTHS